MSRLLLSLMILLVACTFASAEDWHFELKCPHNVWLDCDDQIEDLDAYGIAYIHDNHDVYPAPEPEVHYHLQGCGGGYIKRTWKVTGPYGGWYKCSQFIYIENGGTFDEHDIIWPHDYMIHGCFDNTDPEDLPHGFDKPKINDVKCAEVLYTYKDWIFTPPGGGSCGKVLRKWKVIDWCVYDPNDYHPQGIWEHTQVIKIKGSNDFSLQCPDEITVNTDVACSANVTIASATVTGECPEGVVITNDSPFSFSNGANASGHYPVGNTEVCFTATDGCGNEDVCCTWITVEDQKKPTPKCHSGIVTTLAVEIDGYYHTCPPEVFNKGSFDNCTAKEDLEFRLEPNTFTCADLGENEVRFYVVDESGNENFCITTIIIQDNMMMCPDPDSLTINGSVFTMGGENVENVAIHNVSNDQSVMTDEEGMYSVSNLLATEDYMLVPAKNDEPKEGLDMHDLVVMSEYLFGDNDMDDPYLMIAADIDNNQDVDLQDFLKLRGLILDEYEHFSDFSDQTSWKFVNSDFVFGSAQQPWTYDDYKEYPLLGESQHNENFIGVKIGDLNQNYNHSEQAEIHDQDFELTMRSDNSIIWNLKDQLLLPGQDYTIELPLLDWDSWKAVDLKLNIQNASLKEARASHDDIWTKVQNSATRIFAVRTTTSLENEILTLVLSVNEKSKLSDVVSISSSRLIDESNENLGIDLRWDAAESFLSNKNISANPNPMTDQSDIRFNLQSEGMIRLSLMDTDGKRIWNEEMSGVKGWNQINIGRDEIPQQGVYFLHIDAKDTKLTTKIIVVE